MGRDISYEAKVGSQNLNGFGNEEPKEQVIELGIRPEILEFAYAMEEVMEKHDKEKGESWKNIPIDYLKLKLQEEYGEAAQAVQGDENELVDIGNVAMMIFHRYKHKVNLDKKI